MTRSLSTLLAALPGALAAEEPERMDGDTAVARLRAIGEAERQVAAYRTRLARRIEETNAWRASGERSAAHFVARETGAAVGTATSLLETAKRLDDLPTLRDAFAAGQVSEAQAREIASSAEDATQEAHLLAVAATDSLAGLRQEAQRVRAQNRPTDLRARRSCRTWTDAEGFFRLDARLAPDAGARVQAALDAHRHRVFAEARAAGTREPYDAYTADALERAVTSGAAVSSTFVIRADIGALRSGHVHDGELCEIPGVGPVPVDDAVELLGTSFLKLVLRDGIDVKTVVHLGRKLTAHQLTALLERDGYQCRCTSRFVEKDHVERWSHTHVTTLDDLQLLCRPSHREKTKRDGKGPP